MSESIENKSNKSNKPYRPKYKSKFRLLRGEIQCPLRNVHINCYIYLEADYNYITDKPVYTLHCKNTKIELKTKSIKLARKYLEQLNKLNYSQIAKWKEPL